MAGTGMPGPSGNMFSNPGPGMGQMGNPGGMGQMGNMGQMGQMNQGQMGQTYHSNPPDKCTIEE